METRARFQPHPQSAPGDFYVVNGECISCGVPHQEAPGLMGWNESDGYCIWKKQPSTPAELEQAIAVLNAQDVGCHRYAGSDPAVLAKIPADCCDGL